MKAQIYISRHRLGTDGEGVRTLVSFTGCPLDCKWCINKELRKETPDGKWYTPQELVDELMKDNWYFITTSGGVTFSGGEPLLHSPFIKEFCELCPQDWTINVETSLNVPSVNMDEVLPFVDTFIVDVKDTDPGIYSRYTGESINQVMCNLDALYREDASVVVRLPLIPQFNTGDDVEKSAKVLSERYRDAFDVDLFEYVTDKSLLPERDGRRVCRILKAIRKGLIKENGLGITQPVCRHKGNCPGTCPACEAELKEINSRLANGGEWAYTAVEMDRYGEDLGFKMGSHSQDTILAGMPTTPDVLMGDVCLEPYKELDNEQ